jgi:hypothetical protein
LKGVLKVAKLGTDPNSDDPDSTMTRAFSAKKAEIGAERQLSPTLCCERIEAKSSPRSSRITPSIKDPWAFLGLYAGSVEEVELTTDSPDFADKGIHIREIRKSVVNLFQAGTMQLKADRTATIPPA